MEKLKLNVDWLDELLPEGFPLHTSTLVSGPGGSGKPLIGYIFASSFLKQGGNLIMILTSTTKGYVVNVMKIFGVDLTKYDGRITYIELDVGIEEIEKIDRQLLYNSDSGLKQIILNFDRSKYSEYKIKAAYENYFSPKKYLEKYLKTISRCYNVGQIEG